MPVVSKSTTFKVWCEPIERPDGKVNTGDITEAIKEYQEQTGHLPGVIQLNPSNEKFAGEVPDGVGIEYRPGVLLWEIRLGITPTNAVVQKTLNDVAEFLGESAVPVPAPKTRQRPPAPKKPCPKNNTRIKPPPGFLGQGKGRPKSDLPMAKIRRMADHMTVRAIADKLGEPRSTVGRAVKSLQEKLL